jgi:hypothetical protein
MMFALDGQQDLAQMPFVAALRQATAQFIRELLTEFQRLLANYFVSEEDASARHQLLDIAETQ